MSACALCWVACPPTADAVQAGGDLGWVHDSCFQTWDQNQEMHEAACFGGMSVPLLVAELTRKPVRRRVAA